MPQPACIVLRDGTRSHYEGTTRRSGIIIDPVLCFRAFVRNYTVFLSCYAVVSLADRYECAMRVETFAAMTRLPLSKRVAASLSYTSTWSRIYKRRLRGASPRLAILPVGNHSIRGTGRSSYRNSLSPAVRLTPTYTTCLLSMG